ncbi:hypothetical protein L7F22_036542 [Adiantum nelumboides]|nr:hypothetical protein [Adiantum nelumboides]
MRKARTFQAGDTDEGMAKVRDFQEVGEKGTNLQELEEEGMQSGSPRRKGRSNGMALGDKRRREAMDFGERQGSKRRETFGESRKERGRGSGVRVKGSRR